MKILDIKTLKGPNLWSVRRKKLIDSFNHFRKTTWCLLFCLITQSAISQSQSPIEYFGNAVLVSCGDLEKSDMTMTIGKDAHVQWDSFFSIFRIVYTDENGALVLLKLTQFKHEENIIHVIDESGTTYFIAENFEIEIEEQKMLIFIMEDPIQGRLCSLVLAGVKKK